MTNIRILPADELALSWYWVRPHIDEALKHGVHETSSHDIFVGAMNGSYHIWEISVDGVVKNYGATRINTFNQHKQMQIVTSAGEDWDEYGPEVLKEVERAALLSDCKYVSIWGRPGWERKLKPHGYEKVYTVVMKEV